MSEHLQVNLNQDDLDALDLSTETRIVIEQHKAAVDAEKSIDSLIGW